MKQIYFQSYFRSGYNCLMKYISNIAHMSEKDQATIRERLKIIEFFEEFGEKATKRAFGKGRSTIYLWKQKVKSSGGYLSALLPSSKAPKSHPKRKVRKEIIEFVRQYRESHPGADKVAIKPSLDAFLLAFRLPLVSESTIGRVIADLKGKGLILNFQVRTTINGKTGNLRVRGTTKKEKKLRIGSYQPEKPGDLVQIDAIELFLNGIRRYILTALDVKSRFAFAYCYKTLSSFTARDFMTCLQKVTPFTIIHIQTDNGKEFHKYFREYVKNQKIIHFYNYARQPKMNKYVERFNRTIQDQHVSWNMDKLYEPEEFNQGLMRYLIWYNTEKPHRGIGKLPPLLYYVTNFLNNKLSPRKSNMLWTSTRAY